MIGGLGAGEIIVIMMILILIFGAKRLPEIGKSLGEGIKNFRGAVTNQNNKAIEEENTNNSSNKDSFMLSSFPGI